MVWVLGGIGFLAWGFFCLFLAPGMAERYRRAHASHSPHPAWRRYEAPQVGPAQWRAIGIMLSIVGLWCLYMSLPR